jgi:hypothetical protein
VIITPIVVEVWMSSWWNDQGHVGSGCGSRAPVDCARSHPSHRWELVPWLGALVAPRLARGFHVSLGQGGSELKGSGALMTSRGLWRGVKMPVRGAYLTRDLSARLMWDEVCRSCRKRLTCYPRFW